jgi:hypothetical protein
MRSEHAIEQVPAVIRLVAANPPPDAAAESVPNPAQATFLLCLLAGLEPADRTGGSTFGATRRSDFSCRRHVSLGLELTDSDSSVWGREPGRET